MTAAFRVGLAGGSHWGLAAKACLEQMGPLPPGANLGFLYVTPGLGDCLSSLLTYLRETTGIVCWTGAVGQDVFGPGGGIAEGPGLAIMAGDVDGDALRPFDGFATPAQFAAEHGPWLARHTPVAAVVHGDPRTADLAGQVPALADAAGAVLLGGLAATTATPTRVCGRLATQPLSGLLLGRQVPLATGLAQGCSPIGPIHQVTRSVERVVMDLDGGPALDVLKSDAGEIIARDLKRAAGYIHAAQPIPGADGAWDYAVVPLSGIDRRRGWIEIGGAVAEGDPLMFVHHQPDIARRNVVRMLSDLADRLAGRPVRGGLYIAGAQRGGVAADGVAGDLSLIEEALGSFPLIGFSSEGEIHRDRLHGYAGMLALFL